MTEKRIDQLLKTIQTRKEMQDTETAPEPERPTEPILTQKKATVEKAKTVKEKRKIGKSADDENYMQVSGYIRKKTFLKARNKLNEERILAPAGQKRDFSDLLEDLLAEWVKK